MMLGTGKYTSRQIYGPLTPELQKQCLESEYKSLGSGRDTIIDLGGGHIRRINET